MLTGHLKACMGVLLGSAMALLYALPCSADGSSDLAEMQRELRALRAEMESLRADLNAGKEELKVQNEELLASKREFSQLSEQVRGLRQANPEDVETLKDQIKRELGLVPNVYNDLSRKIRIGMNIRTRGEYSNNFHRVLTHQFDTWGGANSVGDWDYRGGGVSEDETIVLSRIRLNIDADVHEHLRAFFQLQDSRFWGISGSTVALQGTTNGEWPEEPDNTLDLHQGYVDVKKLFNWPLTVRVGRQEIIWGAKGPGAFGHRMMGNFGWSNVARSWEAIRAWWDTESYRVEAFAAIQRHVQRNDFGMDFLGDGEDRDRQNYGGMLTLKKLVPNATLELMYLVDNDQWSDVGSTETFEADELEVHDVGFRIVGKIGKPIDYFAEYHEQFGNYRGQAHRARAGVIGAGYTFTEVAWEPRLGLEFNWSPGDGNGPNGKHKTFHNFYPTNHAHYGYMDMMAWKNMKGLRGQIKVKPTKKMVAWVDIWSFWIDNVNDFWYNAAGIPQRGYDPMSIGRTDPDSHLGTEIDLTAKYKLYKNVTLQAGYSRFISGDYLDDTSWNGSDPAFEGFSVSDKDDDTDWAYLQLTVDF